MPIALRADFDAGQLRAAARQTKHAGQARRLLAPGRRLRKRNTDGSGEDRRRVVADRARLGGKVQREWPRRLDRQEDPREAVAAQRWGRQAGTRNGLFQPNQKRREMGCGATPSKGRTFQPTQDGEEAIKETQLGQARLLDRPI